MRRRTQFSNASKNIEIIWRMNKKIKRIQLKTNALVFFQNSNTGIGFSEAAECHEQLQMHLDLLSEDRSSRNDGWVKSLEFQPNVTSEQIDESLLVAQLC